MIYIRRKDVAKAGLVYTPQFSGILDLVISNTFQGLYLDVDAGTVVAEEATGWDINPFFGGEDYIGFKLVTNANEGPYFGWMRVSFSNDGSTGLIREWRMKTRAARSPSARARPPCRSHR